MVAAGLGVAAATYAGSAALTWYRYGTPKPGDPDEMDPLLDRFMATTRLSNVTTSACEHQPRSR